MFDKFSTKHWIIALSILIVGIIVYEVYPTQKGNSSFKTDIIDIDSTNISSITYYKKGNIAKTVELLNNDNKWRVSQAGFSANADASAIKNIIEQLLQIKPLRIVAKSKHQWDKYEISDSSGTRVIVKEGNKTTLDLIVGKFTAEQSSNPYSKQPDFYTYVRLNGEDDVYIIDGFLAMVFNEDISMFRNKSITNISATDITKLSFSDQNGSFSANKNANTWMIANQELDSTKMASYLQDISQLSSSSFAEEREKLSNSAIQKLKIEGNNFTAIEINAFQADSITQFIIQSSENPESLFKGADMELAAKIFIPIDSLMIK